MSEPVDVVAAIIRNPLGNFYVQQRPEGKELAGKWEFPGGRVEQGEAYKDALLREIREELGVEIEVGAYVERRLVEYTPGKPYRLHFFVCYLENWEAVRGLDGQQFTWVKPTALPAYDFLKPDQELLLKYFTPAR